MKQTEVTYGNSNGTHVKNKNKTGTVARKKAYFHCE